jgi:protein translocase SecG subunit
LVAVLLLQVRGSGTTLFGQAESSYRSRRGVERLMFRSTIVLAGVFVVIAIVNVRLG